jgi:hypothetical protein
MTEKAQTPEAVAYNLMVSVMNAEKNSPHDKEYILTTYEDCIRAVRGNYTSTKENKGHKPANFQANVSSGF